MCHELCLFIGFSLCQWGYIAVFKKKHFFLGEGGGHLDMEAVKLARLLSYRCLGLRVTRCTSPEITHADTPLRQTASSTAEGASGGA